jgi:hypothetical protein
MLAMACSFSRLVMLLLCACGPEDGTSGTDTGMTGMTGTTGATAPTETSGTADAPENVLECGAPSPCGIVLANSGDPGLPMPTAYTADQTCALQQLAKAAPLRLHYNDGCEGMCSGALILIRSDGSAIVEPYAEVFEGGVDLDGINAELVPFAESQLCILKAPAFYEACLAAFDNACTSRSNWFDGCVKPAPAACEP